MRTEDITSITQHRDHLRDHLNQVRETGRPMFITNRGGETEAVMLSAKLYDELMEQVELARSLEDIKAGHVQDGREAMRALPPSMV